MLACQEPTLVVIDDADTEPGVASLVEQASERAKRGEFKVLLLVRDAAAFGQWLNHQLPDSQRLRRPTTTLAAIGGAGDRRRWFVEAARAYAAALDVVPPQLSDVDASPVGTDGEAMIITQARAILAALAGTRERADAIRTAGLDRVTAELIQHERQRWNRAASDEQWGLPAGLTVNDREESLLALVLLAPTTYADAVRVLRRLPLFRDQPEGSLRHVVDWAHHLYPGVGPAQVEPSPDFLRGALLASLTLPEHAELTDSLLSALTTQDGPAVLTRLVRAAVPFATVAPLVGKVVHDQPALLAAAVECLILTGPAARSVEQHLVDVITPDAVSAGETDRLLDLLAPTQFTRLRAALLELAVHHARNAVDENDTVETRATLAASLTNLGNNLQELARRREALAAFEEVLGLLPGLVEQEPARYTPHLATSLNNLGGSLQELGRHRDALPAHEEALRLLRDLAEQKPTLYTPHLATSLNNLGASFRALGRHREALAADEEALGLRRGLVEQEPALYAPDLAVSLNKLGGSLHELGRHRDALSAFEEALGLLRDLAEQESTLYTPDRAASLNNLGVSLWTLGRHRDALTAHEEALALRRSLTEQEPARHTPTSRPRRATSASASRRWGGTRTHSPHARRPWGCGGVWSSRNPLATPPTSRPR